MKRTLRVMALAAVALAIFAVAGCESRSSSGNMSEDQMKNAEQQYLKNKGNNPGGGNGPGGAKGGGGNGPVGDPSKK